MNEQRHVELERASGWQWYICCLLMMATVINYMDRLTLNTLARNVQDEFKLNNEQYGNLELAFGMAYASSSLLIGWLIDRVSVFWLYPIILGGWSAAGFLTGLSETHEQLLLLRIMLGLFEAGHFPCGLKVVQVLLEPRDRPVGNSLLQNGSALGSVLTPIAIHAMVAINPDNWRLPFLVIGAGGFSWVVFWFFSMRREDLPVHRPRPSPREGRYVGQAFQPAGGSGRLESLPHVAEDSFWAQLVTKKFTVLVVMVVLLNLQWHFFRVWMPKYLQEKRDYRFEEMLDLLTYYYLAASVGGLGAGFVTNWLSRAGLPAFTSHLCVYAGCCICIVQTVLAANLAKGPLLFITLLVIGAGSMGAYTAYNTLVQEVSPRHQGKITGMLATITWVVTAVSHPIFGAYLDKTQQYDAAVALAGCLPMISLAVMWAVWPRKG